MIYDIFYVSKQQVDANSWQQFRQRFPSAQKIENIKTIDDAKKKSFTKFFWLVWDDLIITEDFAFDYRVEKWDEEYIHVFLNGSVRDGVCLFPKSATIIQKEFDQSLALALIKSNADKTGGLKAESKRVYVQEFNQGDDLFPVQTRLVPQNKDTGALLDVVATDQGEAFVPYTRGGKIIEPDTKAKNLSDKVFDS